MTLSLSASRLHAPARAASVAVVAGADRGRATSWTSGTLRIGTRPGCDLVLSDPTVSGVHCEIELGDSGTTICDLGSTNGTFVNGQRVEAAYLRPGALLRLGRTQLRFDAEPIVSRDGTTPHRFGLLVGRSPAMQQLFSDIRRLADAPGSVLIEGETGTGKDLVAETLHETSERAGGPFVVFDCARVTPSMLESELFGYVRGAFTGADETRIGVFEAADGGTLFIDEVGDLPLALQPKLLRALESRQVSRLGEHVRRPVDVRVVFASCRDLNALVAQGAFRADLYYRAAVFTLSVPPLRERAGDLELLAAHFLRQLTGDPVAEVPDEVLEALADHDWPGNVRELRNAVERWVVMGARGRADTVIDDPNPDEPFRDAKARAVGAWEREYLRRLLRRHGGNVSQAARAARMNRNHLTELLRKYDVGRDG